MSSIPVNSRLDGESSDAASGRDADDPEPSRPPLPTSAIEVELLWDDAVANARDRLQVSDRALIRAAQVAAASRGFRGGFLGLRITDDATIHQINVQHLRHDYPTDVISFPYQRRGAFIEGELVASLDTAVAGAAPAAGEPGDGWTAADELTLYVVHGVLHIAGMEDQSADDRRAMRRAECDVLSALGIDADRAMEGYGGE